MKAVLLESLGVSEEIIESHRSKLEQMGCELVCYERDDDQDAQVARLEGAQVAIVANMPLAASVIGQSKELRFIDVAFTGVDHIALDACESRHIALSNASGYATQAVAELSVAFMLDLLRNIPKAQERCRDGKTRAGLVFHQLAGKTVGIVGAGAIGTRVASLCKAFGSRVIAYNRSTVHDDAFEDQVSLEALLTMSDIVSVHVPLTAQTRKLISHDELAMMKPTAFLINTARGPVVDQEALLDALSNGAIAGAACDVFDCEPPLPKDMPLLDAPNLIVTPHMAFDTRESMELRAKIVFDNLYAWLEGKQENVILSGA